MSNSTITGISTSLPASTVVPSSSSISTIVSSSDVISSSGVPSIMSTTLIPTITTLDPTDTEILLAPTGDAAEEEEGEGDEQSGDEPNNGGGAQKTYTSFEFVTPSSGSPTGVEESPAASPTLDNAGGRLSVGDWMIAVLGLSTVVAGLL